MLERLQGVGFTPAVALQFAHCLREYVVGHILSHTVAADATADTDHFDIALTAMLDGFSRHLGEIADHT